MIWSKIKRNIESGIAEQLQGRIQFYITSYGKDYDTRDLFNRGWITVDGKQVVNFATPDSFYLNGSCYHYTTPTDCFKGDNIIFENRTQNLLAEKGEFSRFDFSECCYEFLTMSIHRALEHESPIIGMLAILNKRTGKRRLLKLEGEKLHPLVRYFLDLRLEAYNIKMSTQH